MEGTRDHAHCLPKGGRIAYAKGESVKDSNELLKRRKRGRYTVLDAYRGMKPGSLDRRDRIV